MITHKSALRLRFLETLVFICPALFSISCSDDKTIVSAGTGRLSLNIEIDNTFYYPDGAVVGAPEFLLPEIAQTGVFMRSVAGSYSHVWSSFTDFPQDDIYIIPDLIIFRHSMATNRSGFDCPYYSAVADIYILPGQTLHQDMALRPVSTGQYRGF